MDNKEELLKKLEEYRNELEKLTEEDVSFASDYPTEKLVQFVNKELPTDEQKQLESIIAKNVVLKNRYKVVDYLMNIRNIKNIDELKLVCEFGFPPSSIANN